MYQYVMTSTKDDHFVFLHSHSHPHSTVSFTMAPKLRVVISSSSSAYPPHQPIDVNSPKPTPLETPSFKGEISVWIKGYEGDHKGGEGDEYFGEEGREGMTYAIVIKGMSYIPLAPLSRSGTQNWKSLADDR